jgi:DNA-binding transcriptional ArsR family regulator
MQRRHRACFIIRKLETPREEDPEKFIEWLCECFGFDEDELATEIFKDLLKANYRGRYPSSSELCRGRDVTRAAIIYHLNRFIERGLVERRGRAYSLRDSTLTSTIDEIEEDVLRYFKKLKEVAKKIDAGHNIPVE